MPLSYDQWICSGCGESNAEREGVEERYSLGIYAGRWHDKCWDNSGYRKEGPEGFSELDAGERYEDDY